METATLSGVISDPNGGVVPDVEVTATRIETGTAATTKTNGAGIYFFTGLMPGHYHLNVRKPGFKEIAIKEFELFVQDKLEQNFSLEIGSVSESVTVNLNDIHINTTDASVGTVVDRNFVSNLPVNGRSYQALIALTPGIVITPVTANGSDQGQFSSGGMRTNSNYFTVDGVSANFGVPVFQGLAQATSGSLPATNIQGGFSNLVAVDALEEFRIQTSTFAPEFGRSPGAQISLVTRSGNNEFHGAAFEFFRNDATDAKDFFDIKKPPLRFNDFGATLGGPVLVPGIYDGHDRTFFFFSYEGQRFLLPRPTAMTTVPTLSDRAAASNPVSAAILNAFPLPNGPAVSTGGALFATTYSDPNSMDSYSVRVDHNFGSKYSVFGRFNNSPSWTRSRDVSNLSEGNSYVQNTRTVTLGSTQQLTGRLVNESRLNYSRQQGNWLNFYDGFGGGKAPDASLFMPSGFNATQPGNYSFFLFAYQNPNGSVTGVTNGATALNVARSVNAIDNLSYTLGSHRLKFGFDYRWYEAVTPGNGLLIAYLFTQSVPQIYTATPDEISINHTAKTALLSPNYSSYIQDTWAVTRRLTLTYGLRWEVNPSPSPAGSGRALPTVSQAPDLNSFDLSSLALAPLGTPYYPTSYANFGPRVGAAYQVSQKPGRELVFRGGWGLFYDLASTPFGGGSWPYSYNNFIVGNTTPLQLPPNFVQIPPVSFTPSPSNRASGIGIAMPGYNMPKIQEWNVSVEQALGANQSISIGYVASAASDLIRTIPLSLSANNSTPNHYWSPTFSSVTIASNGSSSRYSSMQIQFKRRLARGLQGLFGYTWSHSLDDNSTTTGSRVFSFVYPASLNWGNSDFDVRHSFSGALSYEVHLPHWNTLADVLLNHWSFDTTIFARSGLPFSVGYTERSPSGVIGVFRRADLVPGVPEILHDASVPGGWRINPAAFTLPSSTSPQGTMPRNSLYGFGAWQEDLGLHRVFRVAERFGVEFRAEAFNVFNHPNFANPNSTLTAVPFPRVPANFGVATTSLARGYNGGGNTGGFNPLFQGGGPRSMQFALKLNF